MTDITTNKRVNLAEPADENLEHEIKQIVEEEVINYKDTIEKEKDKKIDNIEYVTK